MVTARGKAGGDWVEVDTGRVEMGTSVTVSTIKIKKKKTQAKTVGQGTSSGYPEGGLHNGNAL